MKRVIFSLLLAVFISAAPCGQAADVSERIDKTGADYLGIVRAVEMYLESGRQGDSRYMKEVFLPEANIYGSQNGKMAGGPIQLLYDLVDGKPAAGEISYQLAAVEISGNIAMLRLEISNWGGNTYTDMFTLIKNGDTWKIASKVSHTH